MSKKQKWWDDQGPRMRGPRQGVGLWQKVSPENHVEETHPARMIWRLVCDLNWERYEERVQSRSAGGRPALERVLDVVGVWHTPGSEFGAGVGASLRRQISLGGQRTNPHSPDFLRVDDGCWRI